MEKNNLKCNMAFPFILLIHLYQFILSPFLGNRCRFYPTCSNYAILALSRFGLIKGFYLTFRRLLHCHPWCPGGIDDVPPNHRKHKGCDK
jgi:uncharacterized protein